MVALARGLRGHAIPAAHYRFRVEQAGRWSAAARTSCCPSNRQVAPADLLDQRRDRRQRRRRRSSTPPMRSCGGRREMTGAIANDIHGHGGVSWPNAASTGSCGSMRTSSPSARSARSSNSCRSASRSRRACCRCSASTTRSWRWSRRPRALGRRSPTCCSDPTERQGQRINIAVYWMRSRAPLPAAHVARGRRAPSSRSMLTAQVRARAIAEADVDGQVADHRQGQRGADARQPGPAGVRFVISHDLRSPLRRPSATSPGRPRHPSRLARRKAAVAASRAGPPSRPSAWAPC